ncbi:MAG: hypothetical protein JST92_27475, partial [Deltaproteobacteria bacterium]|nr:hypothetical protein [Deltaproteobacteria bacterium]
PFIDAHYRTLEGRSQRAVAGFSGGGLDTMILAERHPDLFVAAGSFSGFLDPYSEVGQAVVQEFASLDQDLCGATYGWTAIWGDPAQHPMGWEGHDPLYLPASLADTSVYLAVGNGAQWPSDVDPDPQLETIEGIALGMAQSFDAALTASGVRHTVNYRSCGLHQFAHAGDDLKDFWPQMQRAFGDHAPREFDFSTGDASAGVYGWTFTADAARAPEFLSFTNVSRAGLRATGSGKTVVTTAALFEPGQYVLVWAGGLSLSLVRADRDGRATFTIDLGRAHTLEQGTPEELAAAAADPRYFTTRQVALLEL